MSAKHSPGPFIQYGEFVYSNGYDDRGHTVNRMQFTVGGGWAEGQRTTSDELEATATLLAAAPALADALEALLAAGNEDNPIKGLAAEEQARAALRAAGRLP